MGFRWMMLFVLFAVGIGSHVFAQGTAEDYERSANLAPTLRHTVLNDSLSPRWIKDGQAFTFVKKLADGGFEIIRVDAATGKFTPHMNNAKTRKALAAAISDHLDTTVTPDRTSLMRSQVGDDGNSYFAARYEDKIYFGRLEEDGSAALLDAGADHPLKLTALPPRYPSRRSYRGTEIELVFYNDTAGPVELFYLSRSGGRRSYGTLEPGEIHNQHTYGGHRWLAVDSEGEELVGFIASDQFAVAHITGKITTDAFRRMMRQRRMRGQQNGDNKATPAPESRVYVEDHNLVLRTDDDTDDIQLTTDGTEQSPYAAPYDVSPDGRYVVARHLQPGDRRIITFVESSPRDRLQPIVHTRRYDKPGDNIDIHWPVLVDTETASIVPLDRSLYENPFRLSRFRWQSDSETFTFGYNQRGHQALRLIEVEAATGHTRAIIDERSDTFINYSNKTYVHEVKDTDEIIWMSERSGWNHLYLFDRATGEVNNAITSGDWVVREVIEADDETRTLWLKVMGVYRDQDPYYEHVARVNYDGTGFVLLTASNGTHDRVSFNPTRQYMVTSWSRVDQPPVHELRNAETGELIRELGRADASEWHSKGVPLPEPFVAKGRDGETDIHGVIYRPSTLKRNKKYPIIEKIYAGPHGYHVPKAWRDSHAAQAVAELGFVVVQIDGMGTNWRSKAFHDVAWKNIKDAGFPDRIAWMRAAARKYRYMDTDRVGIFGGSAGGQNALGALLFHGDFYDAASADCGCHDNRMDKIWWNEAWMGWPVDESYAASSNVDNAHRLTGDLLLMVGEKDTNVDPASTMQVVDALIKADKDFELIVFPGGGHGAGGSAYGKRRMYDFFVRNLWNLEPRR